MASRADGKAGRSRPRRRTRPGEYRRIAVDTEGLARALAEEMETEWAEAPVGFELRHSHLNCARQMLEAAAAHLRRAEQYTPTASTKTL